MMRNRKATPRNGLTTYQKNVAIARKWKDLMGFIHSDHRHVNTIDIARDVRLQMIKNPDGTTTLRILDDTKPMFRNQIDQFINNPNVGK